jgi:hypothetical protein
MDQERLKEMADLEDEAVAATGGLLACSPEIMREMTDATYANLYRWLRTHSFVNDVGEIHFGPGCNQTKPELLDDAIADAMRYPIVGEK